MGDLALLSSVGGLELSSLAVDACTFSLSPLGFYSWAGERRISIESPSSRLCWDMPICYAEYETPLGAIVLATQGNYLCLSSITDTLSDALRELILLYPKARLLAEETPLQYQLLELLREPNRATLAELNCLSPASGFRVSVWLATSSISWGCVATYQAIANKISKSKALRAVGTALKYNHLAPFVPCHRVIPSSGLLGAYNGGSHIKKRILEWELSHLQD